MLPLPSRLRPVFIGHAHIGLARGGRVRWCRRRSRTSLPSACWRLMSAILSSASPGQKSSTPDSAADRRGGERLSPVIITVTDAHRPQVREALLHAALDDVLEMNHAERRPALATTSGVPPARSDSLDRGGKLRRSVPHCEMTIARRVASTLADLAIVEVHARHARLRRERDERGVLRRQLTAADAVLFLSEHDDRAALRGLNSASEAS